MKKIKVDAPLAPKALGPYSQAIVYDNKVYLSGQIGIDPSSQELVSDETIKQAEQAFTNIRDILASANSSFENVIKLEIFLTDMNDFAAVNLLCAEIFNQEPLPTRQTVEVSALPKWAKIEISLLAYIN